MRTDLKVYMERLAAERLEWADQVLTHPGARSIGEVSGFYRGLKRAEELLREVVAGDERKERGDESDSKRGGAADSGRTKFVGV